MSLNLSLRVLAVVAAGGLVLGAAGCSNNSPAQPGTAGGSSAPSGTVVWSTWGDASELTRFKQFDDDFMKRYPSIKVTLQPVASYSDYHTKLLAELTSHTAPDVFYIGDDKIGTFTTAGVLAPLDDLMNGPTSETKSSDFYPGLFGAAQIDGVTYAAPNDVNPDVLWYDKTALAAAGITDDPATLAASNQWTTAKFLQMNDQLKAANLMGTMVWSYWSTPYSWISAQDGTVYNDQGQFVGNSDPKTVAAVTTLGQYFQDGKFIVADDLPDSPGPDTLFVTHKAGFYIEGRYGISTVQGANVADSYDIVRWPTVDGSARPTGTAASYLAINKETKNMDAAFLFWTEFLSAQGQIFRLGGAGNAVPSIKGADQVVLDTNYPPHAQTFLDMRDIGFVNYPTEAKIAGLPDDINDLMLQLYSGKADAQSTLDQIAALVSSKSGQ